MSDINFCVNILHIAPDDNLWISVYTAPLALGAVCLETIGLWNVVTSLLYVWYYTTHGEHKQAWAQKRPSLKVLERTQREYFHLFLLERTTALR